MRYKILENKTLFYVHQHDDRVPKEVKEDIDRLWNNWAIGYYASYTSWSSEVDGMNYPVIDNYLKEQGVFECLIHYRRI